MSEGMDIAVLSILAVAEPTVLQSECVWCSQQDRSHAEAETEVETRNSDKSNATKDVLTPRIL